eukprot:CAMPEP_0115095412 /NCGR_PEP_ID=MMETSP0227-20121206/29012_1 /TAXON_ID=89957 /ORGANISM="Polarella glacialis, Strain CCMP 1383" /LENGTH=63 /DNA_ID=CAMNT_0002488749 /DNA_START=103 /DNA_END=294 /DNA_ORIENTATION=+
MASHVRSVGSKAYEGHGRDSWLDWCDTHSVGYFYFLGPDDFNIYGYFLHAALLDKLRAVSLVA